MSQYYVNEIYMKVREIFTQKNGDLSCYNMMMGSGLYTLKYKKSKEEMIKQIIDKLKEYVHYDIEKFEWKETEYGLEFSHYVKCINPDTDDYFKFEPGTIDDYTDHEQYIVEVFKVVEEYGIGNLI